MQLKALVVVIAGAGVAYGVSMADRSMNYVEVQGKVVASEVDCFVKSGRKSLVEKDTDKLAYMDCKLAPIAAEQFGYPQSAVQERVKFTYQYVSPVDGSRQEDKAVRESNVEKYAQGSSITVYAHNEKPGKSRLH